ncbi:MAG: FAD-binding oxidoreductase [Rhodobacterales bacterium]|nr:FAD-binding oxidoreductase [Rhodobacterales bacterium]
MGERYDAVVIGAGIIGASVAFELAKGGRRVLCVDKLPAAGYGSTANSCAIIRTHYSTLDGAAIAHEGYFAWKDWAGHLGAPDERGLAVFRETGCLVMKTEGNGYLETVRANMDLLGVPYEDWDVTDIRRHLPHYDTRMFGPPRPLDDPDFGDSTGVMAGGVFFPRAGYISDPQLASHNVQRAAEARGAEFRFNRAVTAIRRGDRVEGVDLDDGTAVDAPVVVNVAGPHSYKINRLAGVEDGMNIRTRALKQEVVHIPAPPGLDWDGQGIVTSDNDIGCYTRPETGNHILIGSEDPECDERVWVDPDDWDRNFTDQATVQAHRLAQRIPGLGIPGSLKGVVDLYDVSDDWIPIYDTSDLPGFYMAIGTSGNQFKNAPPAGALMAHLIDACEAGHDHDAAPLTFRLPTIGRDIDLGFYSRRRQINPDSSFSVIG